MKTVLITGASGFIGNFLVDEALMRGYKVYAAVRKTSDTSRLKAKGVDIVVVDLSDYTLLYHQLHQLPRFDYIVHNAGVTKTNNKKEFLTVNYLYTKNFINAIVQSGNVPNKILYISSLAAYGPGSKSGEFPILADDFPMPISPYGESKLKAERLFGNQDHLPYLIVRPTAVYGPGERDFFEAVTLINNRLEFYIGRHKQFLTFIYVKDLVRGVFDLLESKLVNKAYFITDGEVYDKKIFGELVAKHLNKRVLRITVPMVLAKMVASVSEKIATVQKKATVLNSAKLKELSASNWMCDTKAIENDINYKARYKLDTGLAETLQWYKNEGWLK